MIRDPSDGSVREAVQHRHEPLNAKVNLPETAEFDTGIRQPTRTDAQDRMERSRQWLKDYQEKRNARGDNGEEHSTDGDSSDDQGEAESGLSAGNGADAGADRQG